MTDNTGKASRDYVESQFSGPRLQIPFGPPPPGWLRCHVCGVTVVFDERPYAEQSACPVEQCDGQMFCDKWPHWRR